jgi:hypothetical protein
MRERRVSMPPMTVEPINNRDVQCRYCKERATWDVTKTGDRPTPECDDHLERSRARYRRGL